MSEVEITPAQIEAGVTPLLTFELGKDDPYEKVREILMVVLGARPAPEQLPPLQTD
jgi:hypothetical protein